MYRDGYLIKCGPSAYEVPQILFCVFGDGRVSYYSEKGGKLMGEISLAGHVTKVKVEKSAPGKLPNRFSISTAEVLRIEGRKMKLADTRLLEFAAPTHDLMKEWANALHLWRRMNWKENVKFFDNSADLSHAEERASLQLALKMHQEAKLKRPIGAVGGKKFMNPLVGILYSTQTPSIKKFRERLRRSGGGVDEASVVDPSCPVSTAA
ncbi:hypothetical protein PybrP1_011757 [[Pythium] brassicae (nom. inval.)]|nr:hypothetical protein PybrP1_011757 [[Pythium] brassicae (nom. inval.)]